VVSDRNSRVPTRDPQLNNGGIEVSHRAIVVFALAIGLGAIGPSVCSVRAQSYPVKPIRAVVGFPPGGGVDVLARQIMPRLSEQLGQQVIIDNRPGAGGNIASELVARSAPDGYVLLLSTPSITVNPALYGNLPFDPVHDFAPITLAGKTVLVLVVHPSLPVRSVKDLIALARAKPGELSYSSGGNGAAAHLAGELFKSMTGVRMVHVPFKGSPPSLVALMAGEVQLTFGTLPSTQPHVRAHRLRALATTGAQRSVFMPDMPTIAEAGIPGYETIQWYGLLAPARTPAAIVTKLHAELTKVLEMPEIKAQLANQSIEPAKSTPDEFALFIKSELAKWSKVVKQSGMRVD
jgi:tripartite-type tricarboxylate transporter receptor subunit TctC